MRIWFSGRSAVKDEDRTENQKGWDSAVIAVSEYVRRRQDYDETLALEIRQMLSTELGKRWGVNRDAKP